MPSAPQAMADRVGTSRAIRQGRAAIAGGETASRRRPLVASGRMASEAPATPSAAGRNADGSIDIATQSLARPATLMAAGTALSRLTGVGRIVAMAFALGVTESRLGDAYNLANTLPIVLYELILGGVLTSVFIPVLVEQLRTKDRDEAWRSISAIVTTAVAFLAGLTLLAALAAPLIIDALTANAAGGDAEAQRDLATFFLRVFAIQIVLFGLVAIAGGLLNAHGRFAVPMFAPVLNNVVVIAMFLTFAAIVDGTPTDASVAADSGQKWLLALGTSGGVAALAAVYWPFLRRLPGRVRPRLDLREPALRKLIALASWTVVYVLLNTLGFGVSFFLASGTQGGVTAYVTAFAFFQLPIGIAAVSIVSALLPKLSAFHVAGDDDSFRIRLAGGLRLTALLMIPATAALLLLADPMVTLLLQHGVVRADSADLVASTLRYFALGLLPFAAFQLFMRSFYARQDARTPALVNVWENAATIGLDLALYPLLDVRGLALAHSLGYVAGALVAVQVLRRRLGGMEGRRTLEGTLRILLAGAACALAIFAVRQGVAAVLAAGDARAIAQLALGGLAGLAAFLVTARVLRVEDLDLFARLLPGR